MFPADAKGIIWENWPLDKVCPCMCVYPCMCVLCVCVRVCVRACVHLCVHMCRYIK